MSLLDKIKEHEGFRSSVYQCTQGVDTIGYGFAIKDLELTKEIAEQILIKKIANLESNISKKSILNYWVIPNFKMSLSFTFAVIALFFIIFNDYNVKQEVVADKNLNNQSLTDIEADTLKNDNFLIKQVKGQKHSK